jgi:hypothetical protein
MRAARRRLLAAADVLPVTVRAAIAGAGSFTHIRDTAAQHGQHGPMSWAIAVCIDFSELRGRPFGLLGSLRPWKQDRTLTAGWKIRGRLTTPWLIVMQI